MRPLNYRESLAASAALHLGVVLVARLLPSMQLGPAPIEIDLSTPFFGDGPAKLGAPKRADPAAKRGPALPAETPLPVQTPTPAVVPPKDWTMPGPQTKIVEAPAPTTTPGGTETGTGTSPLPGGQGAGADYGIPDGRGHGGAPILQYPRLLNKDEVLANLRRFYPERERIAGREGDVMVKIHVGLDGAVTGVDVIKSAGPLFDEAARKVGRLMRFSPAIGRQGPVPVNMPQSMSFRLED